MKSDFCAILLLSGILCVIMGLAICFYLNVASERKRYQPDESDMCVCGVTWIKHLDTERICPHEHKYFERVKQ